MLQATLDATHALAQAYAQADMDSLHKLRQLGDHTRRMMHKHNMLDPTLASRLDRLISLHSSALDSAPNWQYTALVNEIYSAAYTRALSIAAKLINDIHKLGGTIPHKILARYNSMRAIPSMSRTVTKAHAQDNHARITPQHAVNGPAKAITGRAHYEILKHKHKDATYMDIYNDGVYSHKIPHQGPCRIDALGHNIAPARLPKTDSLAGEYIMIASAIKQHTKSLTSTIDRANVLAARSHRRANKRGSRRRGKGKGKIDRLTKIDED